MAWIEHLSSRQQHCRVYRDATDPAKRLWSGVLAELHYETELDSGIYDAEADMTPMRVNVASFDGWRVTANGWHYALGKDIAGHGDEDGWMGFGGRQGQNWFRFRLLRVGYLHWPTQAWDDIGGAPNYDRANLARETRILTLGPNDDEIAIESVTVWSDIWNTPGGGAIDIEWKARGGELKEEITVNQMARDWITANRPPVTPLDETWFGFMFEIDWSDIPRIYLADTLKSPTDVFADDGETIYLRDSLDRLLAFMPTGYTKSGDIKVVNGFSYESLRKRFWSESGKSYLLVGIRCDVLNGMVAGDLTFDPTINAKVDATNEDARDIFDAGAFSNTILGWGSWWSPGGLAFDIADIGSGNTIDTAVISIRFQDNTDWGTITVWGEDADNGQKFTTALTALTKTSASATWAWSTHGTADYVAMPSVQSIVQEIVDRPGWSAGNTMTFQLGDEDQGSDVTQCYDYTDSAAYAAKLDIEYTAGATYTVTAAINTVIKMAVGMIVAIYVILKETASSTAAGQAIIQMVSSVVAAGRATLKETANVTAAGYAVLKESASQTAAGRAVIEMVTRGTSALHAVLEEAYSVTTSGLAALKETAGAVAAKYAVLKEAAEQSVASRAVLKETVGTVAHFYASLKEAASVTVHFYAVLVETKSVTAATYAYLQDLGAVSALAHAYAVLKETVGQSAAARAVVKMASSAVAAIAAYLRDRTNVAPALYSIIKGTKVTTPALMSYLESAVISADMVAPLRQTTLRAAPRGFTATLEKRNA
jgi:hypothetical protein